MTQVLKAFSAPLLVGLVAACSAPSLPGRAATSPSPPVGARSTAESSPAPESSAAAVGSSPAGEAGSPGGAGTSNVESCVVGRWVSAAFSNGAMGSATISGGAGVHLTITDRGDFTVDYNGMQPLEVRFASGSTGTGTLQGVGHAVITARSGTMTPSSYEGSGVRVNAVMHSSDGSVTPVNLPLGDVFGLAMPEHYSCSGGSLTFMRPDRPDLHFRRQ
jgi:hypothetical protein